MALNWEKKHATSSDERRKGTLSRGISLSIVERVACFVARRWRPPLSLATSVTFTLATPPPCFCPFLLPKEKQDRTREDEGGRDMVGSSGLSLGDGWFYPNAINSPTPRAHASRVKLTLVPRAPLATGIAMLPLNLARRCIPLLWVLEIGGEGSFRSAKSMAATSRRTQYNIPTFLHFGSEQNEKTKVKTETHLPPRTKFNSSYIKRWRPLP